MNRDDDVRCLHAHGIYHVGELLAVIHGDGGHYAAEHGTQKAAADALVKVHAMMLSLAQNAQAVDVGAIREVINYLQDEGNACMATGDGLDAQWGSRILSMSRKLTRAISNKKE